MARTSRQAGPPRLVLLYGEAVPFAAHIGLERVSGSNVSVDVNTAHYYTLASAISSAVFQGYMESSGDSKRRLESWPAVTGRRVIPVQYLAASHEQHAIAGFQILQQSVEVADAMWDARDIGMNGYRHYAC